jgi:hypothetical protein
LKIGDEEMAKERAQIERCLAVVEAYEASGQKAGAWAVANGVTISDLSSWCAHAQRWRVRLGRISVPAAEPTAVPTTTAAFVRAAMPAGAAACVRVEWPTAAGAAVALHWPMSHMRELGAWLREVSR